MYRLYNQEIFEFIRDNLRLVVSEQYQDGYRNITCKLVVTNPETGKGEEISSDSFSVDT